MIMKHDKFEAAPGFRAQLHRGADETPDGPQVAAKDMRPTSSGITVSVVTPMYNEAGGARDLIVEIDDVLKGQMEAGAFEIIAVDDASSDHTRTVLRETIASVPALRVLTHQMNAGQSRALRTGIVAASGHVIITLDGDGQNDPADIPALLARLGADDHPVMVGGERQARQDSASKKRASRLANRVRAALLKDGARDTGCGLKVFYRDAYLRLPYFDHNHRYLPALMAREGFSVVFHPVAHRPRRHGASKYTNLGRLGVAFRDLLGVMWLNDRARPPIGICELNRHNSCDITPASHDHARGPDEARKS